MSHPAIPHPKNPVAKDQKFLTCGGCKHAQSWRGKVGECWHPEHTSPPATSNTINRTLSGRMSGALNGDVSFEVNFQRVGFEIKPHPITDLMCCSNWGEKLGG